MKYMGGKCRTGKRMFAVLKKLLESRGMLKDLKGYIEPFCGALGLMRYMGVYMDSLKKPAIASDGCEDLIILWREVQNNMFEKPVVTKELWKSLKDDTTHSALRAFVGFGQSFNGMWFATFIPTDTDVTFRSLESIRPSLTNIQFQHKDYLAHTELVREGGYLIHCDPPYANSVFAHEASAFKFDMKEFWDTMRLWHSFGNIVVISERVAPDDFECIWQATLLNSRVSKNKTYVDKLFMYNPTGAQKQREKESRAKMERTNQARLVKRQKIQARTQKLVHLLEGPRDEFNLF